MKTKILPLLLIVLAAGIIGVYSFSKESIKTYIPRDKSEYIQKKDAHGAIEWRHRRQANPLTGEVDINDVMKAQEQVRALKMQKGSSTFDMDWIEMGPDNIGGRTRAILIDKDNPETVFAGGVSGGLWKSINAGQSWKKVTTDSDQWENINVVSICQASNGDIYVGTGEGMYTNSGEGSGGLYGQGIWKSTDHGVSWSRLESTWQTTTQSTFRIVNKLAVDPNDANRIYAATQKGVQVTDDGGLTWFNPLPVSFKMLEASDVKVASDGTVIAAVGNQCLLSSTGDSATFVDMSRPANQFDTLFMISEDCDRLEFAFSPDDPNYIYCLSSKSNKTQYVYRSIDKGETWNVLATGSDEYFSVLGTQGTYANVIAVFPGNKERVIAGGLDIWMRGGENQDFHQITIWNFEGASFYVHADIHAFTFHPNYETNKTFYVGTDGGVFKSTDGGSSFYAVNRGYNVTQMYDVAYSPKGQVMGGTQDNGTPYITLDGNTVQTAISVTGGDGGYTEMSVLNPDAIFSTIYYTQVYRIVEEGTNPTQIVDLSADGLGNFVTPIRLWESNNDTYSADSVYYLMPTELPDTIENPTYADSIVIAIGDTINYSAKSKINNLPIPYTHIAERDYLYGDTVKIQDPYQAAIAVGHYGEVLFSRVPLDLSRELGHYNKDFTAIGTNMVGTVESMAFSKDGNYLYIITNTSTSSYVYRIDSLMYARNYDDYLTLEANQLKFFSGRIATGITVDPNNSERIVVTLGGYGETNSVYYCDSAATGANPIFTNCQGNLPEEPVYTALIEMSNNKLVFVGTESGVYYTEDITASPVVWSFSDGFPSVATFSLRQQTWANSWKAGVYNSGYIYAGTHGRGIWRTETLKGPTAIKEVDNIADRVSDTYINIFPNPTSDVANLKIKVSENSNVQISVYDLQGKLVINKNYTNQIKGLRNYKFNVESLEKGTYIVKVVEGSNVKTSKFIKY